MHDYLDLEIQQAAYWRNIAKRDKAVDAKLDEVLARAYEIKQQYDATLAELPRCAVYKVNELMR